MSFKLSDVTRYDEEIASYILDKGTYIYPFMNSLYKTIVFLHCYFGWKYNYRNIKNVGSKSDFGDLELIVQYKDDLTDVEKSKLTEDYFTTKEVKYDYQPLKM